MTEQSQTPGEQPVNEIPDATGEQPVTDHLTEIEGMDQAGLAHALFNPQDPKPDTQEQPANAEDLPTEEPAAPLEPATESEQPPNQEEPAQAAQRPLRRLSVNHLAEDDKGLLVSALDLVRKGDAANLPEALQKVSGKIAPPADPSPPAPSEVTLPATPPSPGSSPIADIESKLADLRAQRTQATLDYDSATAASLTDQIEDTLVELTTARSAAVQQQQSASTYHEEFEKSAAAMEERFPQALDESSKFFELLSDKVTAAEARKDPALNDPNYIMKFAEDVAEILKSPVAPPPAPPQRQVQPAGSGLAPGHTVPARLTPDQALSAIESASQDQLAAVLFPR